MADSDLSSDDGEEFFAEPQSHWDSSLKANGDAPKSVNGNAGIDEPESKVPAGMICEVTNLYQSKPDKYGSFIWVDKYPADLEDPVENAKTARYALLVRNKRSNDTRKKLRIDSIMVQSPLLKTAIGRVLKNYPGITTSLDRLEFRPPFKPFVHRWADLVAALKDEEDTATKSHLELFHRIMEEELRDELKARDDYILNKVITYDTCWMLFEPDTIVLEEGASGKCALRVKDAEYETSFFMLSCERVDWDGDAFGLAQSRLLIFPFSGTTAITDLETFPLQYHENPTHVKKELIERGKVFEKLCGYHYKQYSGVAVGSGPWGPIRYNVDSRILIDTYAWNRFNPDRRVSLQPLDGSSTRQRKDSWNDYAEEDVDYGYDGQKNDDESDNESSHRIPGPLRALTDDELLLCNTTVKGYSLKDKKWLTFPIGPIGDIEWNDQAFERLVLPNDHKDLILALIESQVANKDQFDDVIQGKGKGMIMLLSGPPGVGKTLTAESVSENIRAPLYMMSAGDLGLSSSDVESSLSNVLEMCTKWNAVLLIDEADVFLEQRSAHDLERNKLVSIFLRMLEYYEGILFLTTNRVENIDAAFQSRIHISMEYSELSTSSRRHIWSNFLSSGGTKAHAISEAELDKLAEYRMNGREIKNVLKTSHLLAGRKKEDLAVSYIESVLAIERRHVGHKGEEQKQ